MPRGSTTTLRSRLQAELTRARSFRKLFVAAPSRTDSGPIATVRRVVERGASRASVERLVEQCFDTGDIARRCLGAHWAQRTARERDEATVLIRGVLARAHFGRLDGAGRVVFTGERIQGETAWIRCWLTRPDGLRLPVEYRLQRVSGRWLVADFTIDGNEFVKGHGAYLRGVVEAGSFEDLLWKLRLKEAEASGSGPHM